MSGSQEEVFEIGETIDDRDQEAQPLPGAMSPILWTPKGRGSERTVRVSGSLRAVGVGGNGAAGVGRAVDDGAGASGGVAADVLTPAKVYGKLAEDFFAKLQEFQEFNPLKRKVNDLQNEIVSAQDKVVALKAELFETENEMQKMQPIVDDMQKKLRDMTQTAGKDD